MGNFFFTEYSCCNLKTIMDKGIKCIVKQNKRTKKKNNKVTGNLGSCTF